MKIAIVLPPHFRFSVTSPNSIETVVRTLAAQSRYRETIRVLCDESDEDTGDIVTIRIDPSGGRRARTRRAVAALRDWTPDIIELHQHAPTAGRIARAFPDRPKYLYRHNFLKQPKTLFQRLRYNLRYAPFDGLVFVSESNRRLFAEVFPQLASRCYAIPNAIDSTLWYADVADREPVIAYTGRAAPEKGFGELCRALEQTLELHPDWRSVLVTNEWDTHRSWAEGLLSALDRFGDRVVSLKNQPLATVRDTLQKASIAVVPSIYYEAFGLAAVEAHAAGAAVISSGVGGLREASGDHALYLDTVTQESIAAALAMLIRDPDRRLALAEAGQRYVAEEHSVERRAKQLDDLRESLVTTKARRPKR